MVSQDFRRQLGGYGLTTANILYRRPDHPWLLQSYVWQDYDLCPVFPALNKFLNFWLETLDTKNDRDVPFCARRPCARGTECRAHICDLTSVLSAAGTRRRSRESRQA